MDIKLDSDFMKDRIEIKARTVWGSGLKRSFSFIGGMDKMYLKLL